MAAKKLRCALEKLAKGGSAVDVANLHGLLVACDESTYGVDVSLRVALKVSELCVTQQQGVFISAAWFCLSFFLHEQTYVHAEQFANSFLRSSLGQKAFDLATTAVNSFHSNTDAGMIPGYLLRFLSKALWRHSCRVFAARTYAATYRAALGFITNNSQSLSMLERAHVIALFDCLLFEDVADHAANGEHIQGLEQFVLCGGLSAFSGVHYFICATADGSDQSTRQMIVITELCTSLLNRLSMQYISDSVEKRLKEWCVLDSTASDGMAASFYALFDTPNDPRTPVWTPSTMRLVPTRECTGC
jgi:hypothetical protein